MTNRRKRVYESIIVGLSIILMALCAYMGITAVQKSMRLNVSFSSTPNVACCIGVKKTLETPNYTPIFDNKANQIAGGVRLSGNSLIFDDTRFSNSVLGGEYYLSFTNYSYTGSAIILSFSNANVEINDVEIAQYLVTAGERVENIQITHANSMTINMQKCVEVTLNTTGVELNTDYENTTLLEKTINEVMHYYQNPNQDMKIQLKSSSGYAEPPKINSIQINGSSYETSLDGNNILTIPANAINGDIVINTSAEVKTECEITFDWNNKDDGLVASYSGPTTFMPGQNLVLVEPTKNGCEFLGWTYEGMTTPTKNLNLSSFSDDLHLTANWGAVLINGEQCSWHSGDSNGKLFTILWNFFRGENPALSYDVNINLSTEAMSCYADVAGTWFPDGTYYSSSFSLILDYWNNSYKALLGLESFEAGGTAIDKDNAGTIKVFQKNDVAYILSPYKIFANENSVCYFSGTHCSLATYMGYVLSIQSLEFNNFDTSKVTNMSNMFWRCGGLTSLDVSNFDTSNVTDMCAMFSGCSSLTKIYASSAWDVSKVTSSSGMFTGCSSLVGKISYNSEKVDHNYANYDTGYFTYKAS